MAISMSSASLKATAKPLNASACCRAERPSGMMENRKRCDVLLGCTTGKDRQTTFSRTNNGLSTCNPTTWFCRKPMSSHARWKIPALANLSRGCFTTSSKWCAKYNSESQLFNSAARMHRISRNLRGSLAKHYRTSGAEVALNWTR